MLGMVRMQWLQQALVLMQGVGSDPAEAGCGHQLQKARMLWLEWLQQMGQGLPVGASVLAGAGCGHQPQTPKMIRMEWLQQAGAALLTGAGQAHPTQVFGIELGSLGR